MRLRARHGATLLVTSLAVLTAATLPSAAVNADHGNRVVSANPADVTPHVMNGSVNAITQVGNKIIAAGTFTSVSPAGTFGNTGDDLVRNRIFAFDATTGAIDTGVQPEPRRRGQLAGHRRHLRLRRRAPSARSAATPRSSGWSS